MRIVGHASCMNNAPISFGDNVCVIVAPDTDCLGLARLALWPLKAFLPTLTISKCFPKQDGQPHYPLDVKAVSPLGHPSRYVVPALRLSVIQQPPVRCRKAVKYGHAFDSTEKTTE